MGHFSFSSYARGGLYFPWGKGTVFQLLFASLLLFGPGIDAFGSSRRYGGSYRRSYGGHRVNYYSARQSLAEVLSSSPSNKDPTVAEGKDPIVPTKLKKAPRATAQVYWSSSRTFASP